MRLPPVLACWQSPGAAFLGSLNDPFTVAFSLVFLSFWSWGFVYDRLSRPRPAFTPRVRAFLLLLIALHLVHLAGIYYAHTRHFTGCHVTRDPKPSWRELLLIPVLVTAFANVIFATLAIRSGRENSRRGGDELENTLS